MINNLYLGDCLEIMQQLPDKSIDAVITDIPYGTTACKWDVVIPLEPMWSNLARLIKPNGVIVLFGSQPFTSLLITSKLEWFKYEWIWIKNRPTGAQHAKNRPMSRHENILVFSPAPMGHKSLLGDKRMTYNPQGVIDSGIKVVKSKGFHSNIVGPRPNQVGRVYMSQTGFPSTDLHFDKEEIHVHPTQKPVKLMKYLINTYSNENDTILDFTMGSGSTGIACINTNRNFIGIEKSEKYFNIANERMNTHYEGIRHEENT